MTGRDVIEKYCRDYANRINLEHYEKCVEFIRQCDRERGGEEFNALSFAGIDMCPNNYGVDCESLCDAINYFYNDDDDFQLQRAQCVQCWEEALGKQV